MFLKQCEVESRVEYFKGDIQEILKSRKTIKKWAYILHDKDDTENHYHIYTHQTYQELYLTLGKTDTSLLASVVCFVCVMLS